MDIQRFPMGENAFSLMEGKNMSDFDLKQFIEKYHRCSNEFVKGNPEMQKTLFSHRDDVTLANPLGPPARGWAKVEQVLEFAASQLREGEPFDYERISENGTAELAYILEIERGRAKVGGASEFAEIALRVTTVFRPEDGEWKIVHRHADPITTPRAVDSLLIH